MIVNFLKDFIWRVLRAMLFYLVFGIIGACILTGIKVFYEQYSTTHINLNK